jgi:hypothetical protein
MSGEMAPGPERRGIGAWDGGDSEDIEDLLGQGMGPRSLGSHFSARSRWMALGGFLWAFGVVSMDRGTIQGFSASLGHPGLLALLLGAVLILLFLVSGFRAREPGTGNHHTDSVSGSSLLFLGVLGFGLSYLLLALSIIFAGDISITDPSAPGLMLLFLAPGLSLIVLGLGQVLANDPVVMSGKRFHLCILLYWAFLVVFLSLMVRSRLLVLRSAIFSSTGFWGRSIALIFLDMVDLSGSQSLGGLLPGLLVGPFTWLVFFTLPVLALRVKGQESVNLLAGLRQNMGTIGVLLLGLGVCYLYSAFVFALGLSWPEILRREGEIPHTAMPTISCLLLAATTLACGILMIRRGRDTDREGRLARFLLTCLATPFIVMGLIWLVGTFAGLEPGFLHPDPSSVLFRLSILYTAAVLVTLSYRPGLGIPGRYWRGIFSVIVSVVLLVALTPSVVGYFRAVITDLQVDLVDLGPSGTDRRTRIVVTFMIKNRGPAAENLEADFFVDDAPNPESFRIDEMGKGSTVIGNTSFQVVTPKTYQLTIHLRRNGHRLDTRTLMVNVPKPQT